MFDSRFERFFEVCLRLQGTWRCAAAVRAPPASPSGKASRSCIPSTWSSTWWQAAWSTWCGRTWAAGRARDTTSPRSWPWTSCTRAGSSSAWCVAAWCSWRGWRCSSSTRCGWASSSFASPPSSSSTASIWPSCPSCPSARWPGRWSTGWRGGPRREASTRLGAWTCCSWWQRLWAS